MCLNLRFTFTGLHDPSSTYARKGGGRVLIKSNSESDGKRLGTAQVLCRGIRIALAGLVVDNLS